VVGVMRELDIQPTPDEVLRVGLQVRDRYGAHDGPTCEEAMSQIEAAKARLIRALETDASQVGDIALDISERLWPAMPDAGTACAAMADCFEAALRLQEASRGRSVGTT
jgi:hypothetical protein